MKLAAGIGAAVALALGAPHAQQTDFRARADVVEIDAAVKDGSRTVTSLTRDDFVSAIGASSRRFSISSENGGRSTSR